ncbi:phosphatidylglycerophosphatase A [Bacteriovorax sp. PP10]|uniref:Phosphatidylglycerophosphatase A n=1 Tax=Bacteriovorax antarcticus TaxID=3088717 RepID=A0ABU5VRI0_9BACT|nr:phosphatidylglycerophosphatase A [Bacteriovorax sp. PP10]MEA9354635.1 phosphatidylglycerophosphatase A [Bacteriovorax sp. PP10]
MNEANRPSLKRLDILFLSFFGVGFLPKAPGTWGTLATLPFLYGLGTFNPPYVLFIPFIIIMTIISSFIADIVQKKFNLHDPQFIVIDEVLGMTTAWLFIQKHNLLHLFILFALFRFFDIIKVWPASYFDKQVDHGAGTILDDIVSGVFAGVVYLVINYVFSIHLNLI